VSGFEAFGFSGIDCPPCSRQLDQSNLSTKNSNPLVSIGVPIFNGEHSIADTLSRLLVQSYQNIELIVSDNCSTDNTQKICESFATRDKRIKYFRQSKNEGVGRNFRFVLEQARGKYFFWNAGDDSRSADFVAVNVAFLEAHPDYCASTSPTRDEGGKFNPRWMGDRALDQDTLEKKILTYFKGWHRNAIFYSMYRREVMANHPILYGPEHLGQDWTMMIYTAKLGHFQRLDQGELILGKGGISKGIQHMRSARKRPIEWFFPHWELSMFLKEQAKDFSLRGRMILFVRAVILNIRANLMRLVHILDR
jgi:glycosyltransferase involved in cell wall biosynthesis